MNSPKPKGSYAYSALALAILAASSEFAVAQGSESAQSVQLEEVFVTAQRRSQDLQDVAGAISAFSGFVGGKEYSRRNGSAVYCAQHGGW